MVLSVCFMIACATSSSDCVDLACRRDQLVAAWETDPGAVTAEIDALEDPLARTALVEAVVEAHPADAARLCELLPQGFTRTRCDAISQRPHLWRIRVEDPASEVAFSGEAVALLAPGPHARPLPVVTPRPVGCGPRTPERSCRATRAIEAARAGDRTGARAICAGIDDVRWRSECLFDAVERSCRRARPDGCPTVVELCLDAGPFRVPCLEQVASELAAAAPRPSGDWRGFVDHVEGLRRHLAELDARVAERLVGRTWAEALVVSTAGSPSLSLNDLAGLPTDAAPHVRAVLALRAVSARRGTGLASLAAALLSGEDAGPPVPVGRVQGGWALDLPGEDALPVVAWLGGARRTVSEDPDEDLRIALVEAAALVRPPVMDLLVEAAADPSPLVRWTAARRLAQVAPDHGALAALRSDPDPLVRARAGG